MAPRTRRLVKGSAILLVVAVVLVWALAPRPLEVDLAEVTRGPLEVTLDEEGETRVRERYLVSAPVAGRVQRIELEPGDPVRADETVVATFVPTDPALLDPRARSEARARIGAAEAALATAEAERSRVEAEHALASREAERVRRLAPSGIVSEELVEQAETRVETTAESARAAAATVERARQELALARAALIEPGRDGEGRAVRIRSPIDGVVLRRLHESEAVVPSGAPLLEVGDPERLEVVADYLSTDAVRIRPDQRARIEDWGGETELAGRVRRVEPSGFTKISALGVEEQRVDVVLDFDEPREAWEALGDRYRVEVAVLVWQAEDVVLLPTNSLFRNDEGWAVYVVEDGRARLRPVEIGRRGGRAAEVLGGVEPGDRVIVHPGNEVADGARVEPRA